MDDELLESRAPCLVRRADARDIEALLGLIDEVQGLHVQHRPEMFKPTELREVQGRLEELLPDPLTAVWVAELESVVCGYLVAIIRTQPLGAFSFARRFVELDQIGVKGGFRRRGVARSLIATALAHADGLGIPAVELSSWSFNRDAHRAFAQLGFVPKVVRFERRRE